MWWRGLGWSAKGGQAPSLRCGASPRFARRILAVGCVPFAGRTALRPKTACAPPPPCTRARASTRPHLEGIRHPGSSVFFGRPVLAPPAVATPAPTRPDRLRYVARCRSLLRFADPSMSAPARQPASAFRASARRAPHGPAAEDAGPSATAVAAVFRDGALLHWSLVLGNRTFSPEPLPWPALRGAIRAPGRSKRRPSMSAVPSASCSFFLLVHTPPCRFGAFSPTRRYRGDLQRVQPPSCRAALLCPALTRSRLLSRVTNGK